MVFYSAAKKPPRESITAAVVFVGAVVRHTATKMIKAAISPQSPVMIPGGLGRINVVKSITPSPIRILDIALWALTFSSRCRQA